MAASDLSRSGSLVRTGFLEQDAFRRRLRGEQLRAQRSGASFLLLLLESAELFAAPVRQKTLEALDGVVRDTDAAGWYAEGSVAGFILIECEAGKAPGIADAVTEDLRARILAALGEPPAATLQLSHQIFPESAGQ